MDRQYDQYLAKFEDTVFERANEIVLKLQKGSPLLEDKAPEERNSGGWLIEEAFILLTALRCSENGLRNRLQFTEEEGKRCLCEILEQQFGLYNEDGFLDRPDGTSYAMFDLERPYVTCMILEYVEAMGDERLEKFRARLKRSAEVMLNAFDVKGFSKGTAPHFRGLNLIVMDLPTYHLLGRYFEIPEWIEIGRAGTIRTLESQNEEGCFPDNYRTPSADYMYYTLHTLLLASLSFPEEDTAERIAKGVDWMLRALYPSMVPIATFDARERTHCNHIREYGAIGLSPFFLFSPGGREVIRRTEEIGLSFYHAAYPMACTLYLKWFMEKENPKFLEILGQTECWPLRKERYHHRTANGKPAS